MRLIAGLVLVSVLSPAYVAAQARGFTPSANPVSDAVRSVLGRQSKNLIASAELMPAEKYGFHPTPAQMTFGQLVVHIIQTNFAICAGIADVPVPMDQMQLSKLDDTGGKDALVPLIRQSFEYCSATLTKATDAVLPEEASAFGRAMGVSRAFAMVTIATDWTDHYSTAATYLRLNGILPPSAPPPK